MVFKKRTITNDDLCEERCSQILTEMKGAIYFLVIICGQNRKDQNGTWTFVVPNQPSKISSPKGD
jgi:hypothetical protein